MRVSPRYRRVERALASAGASSHRPFSGPPSNAAKQAPESNRGQHSQSIEPPRETSAPVWLWFGPGSGGLPLFVGIGLIKLTFAVGLALIATGAVGLRLANRTEARRLLEIEDPEVVTTGD